MTQELRNAIYGAAAAVIPFLVTFGLITAGEADQLLQIINMALTSILGLTALYIALLAWWKSRRATTTVIDVPKDKVVEVVTTSDIPNVDADSNPVES